MKTPFSSKQMHQTSQQEEYSIRKPELTYFSHAPSSHNHYYPQNNDMKSLIENYSLSSEHSKTGNITYNTANTQLQYGQITRT